MSDLACKRKFPGYDARMSVKNLTISLVFLLMAACGRQPEVRVYLEEILVPAQGASQAPGPMPQPMPPGMPPEVSSGGMGGGMEMELPPDHPLRGMRAPPLTVEPIPENLPEGHPTFDMAGAPVLTDPNQPGPRMPAPQSSAASPVPPPMSQGLAGASTAAPMAGRESEVPPPPAAQDLVWEVPEGWRQVGGTGMRLASFVIEGDESGAMTTLIVLGSAAGGLEANVARWRRERSLPPEAPNPPMQVGGALNFFFVDMVNESLEAGAELTTVGAIFDLGDRTAFLKFVGPPDLVARQRIPFLQLAGSLRQVEVSP
jgi:hypothetical protein